MKVIRGFSTDPQRPLMDPLLESNGFFFEFRGGDVCHPKGEGKWFEPPYFPDGVWRWFCKWPVLPFFAWRLWGRHGYAGFKAYGADSPAYRNWMNPDDVYEGSQALHVSIRPFARVKD